MTLETNAELLARGSIFQGLSPEQLSAIASSAKKSFFEAGATIVEAEKAGDTAYLILSGEAASRPPKNEGYVSEKLGAGTLIGELAMLVDTVYPVTIMAEGRVRALAIARKGLYEVMEADPSISAHFQEILLGRLTALAHDLHEVDAKFAALEETLDVALAAVA
jgi:CRP/FNR family transcriptional regulator, cyclic AMP receptor protein